MDAGTFKKVWLCHWESLYRAAYGILGDSAAAKDAVCEAYLRLWKARFTLSDVTGPLPYSLMVLRNVCLDAVRRQKVRKTLPLDENAPSGEATPETALMVRDRLRRVESLMETLPEKEREVLRMRVYEGMSYSDISKKTGLSEGNLRVLLSQARKYLRTHENDLKTD